MKAVAQSLYLNRMHDPQNKLHSPYLSLNYTRTALSVCTIS